MTTDHAARDRLSVEVARLQNEHKAALAAVTRARATYVEAHRRRHKVRSELNRALCRLDCHDWNH